MALGRDNFFSRWLRGAGDRVADIADQNVDERLVVRLFPVTRMTGSVPDGRTRSRPCEPKRAVSSAIAFATADSERPAALETNVAQNLRHRLEPTANLARRLAELLHYRQHLHRRHETVAVGRKVGQDDCCDPRDFLRVKLESDPREGPDDEAIEVYGRADHWGFLR